VRCLVQRGADSVELRALGNVAVVEGDLTDAASLQAFFAGARGAVLLHVAGVIHPRRSADFERVNVQGARNVLEGAVKAGVRRAVLVSSNSPLGCNPHPDHCFDEGSPYRPYMGYGRSKMRMEQHALEQHRAGNLEVVLVRPPWFYGPGQPARQTLFFRLICEGRFPIFGDGENRRSMAYVDNLCQGVLLAARLPQAAGQIYWIADERPYTMNEIVGTVAAVMKDEFGFRCSARLPRLPGVISDVATAADWLIQGAGFYHQKVHVLSEMNKSIACTIEKAKRELGYRPAVSLHEGMRRSIQWCLERGLLAKPQA
jgi:nucleoside-diphosphate-sugar epimerase